VDTLKSIKFYLNPPLTGQILYIDNFRCSKIYKSESDGNANLVLNGEFESGRDDQVPVGWVLGNVKNNLKDGIWLDKNARFIIGK